MSLYDKKMQKKLEAINRIRKIYSRKKSGYGYFNEWDGSFGEKRDSEIKDIIEKLEKDLYEIQAKINYGNK